MPIREGNLRSQDRGRMTEAVIEYFQHILSCSQYATSLTIAGEPFPVDIIPEVAIGLGCVPIADYPTPGKPEMAASVRGPISQSNAILLSHHGSLTVGHTLEEALIALERIEHTSRSYFTAKSFGKIVPLSADEMERLQAIGRQLRGEIIGIHQPAGAI